jgi:hypothetical protein
MFAPLIESNCFFFQVDNMDSFEMKKIVETALSQLDAPGSPPPSSMSY